MLIDGLDGLAGQHFPVVVIGSGPVGLSLAVALARRGVGCAVLESGGLRADEQAQSLSDADLAEPLVHDDMRIAVARRLGGTSTLWGGRCLPLDPIDFADRPWVDASWPIDHSELMAWMPAAAAATGSGAPVYRADTLWPDADSGFSADHLERWVNVQSSATVFKHDIAENRQLHVHTHATVVGIDFAANGRASAVEVAHTLSGERVRLPVKHLVLAMGGLETTRLLLAAARDTPGRFGSNGGPLGRHYMAHVVGEIADIVFRDPATALAMDFAIDRHGSYARRRFVASDATQVQAELLNTAFWPVVPPVADPRHRNAILSMVYLALRDRRLGNLVVAEAIRRRHIPDPPGPILPHLANVVTGLPGALAFSADFLRRRHARAHRLPGFFVRNPAGRYGLAYHGEHAPSVASRVDLTAGVDRLGLPKLAIDLRFAERDAASIVRSHDLLDGWLRRNAIGAIEYRDPAERRGAAVLSQAAHGTHQIGLARMARDADKGVVSPTLTTFHSSNLHLAGSAVFPTSGQANPTLTAVALGLRLADHLATQVERGAAASRPAEQAY
jgi:glycine/D-amino acid oxidase-like deaminating enzyme